MMEKKVVYRISTMQIMIEAYLEMHVRVGNLGKVSYSSSS